MSKNILTMLLFVFSCVFLEAKIETMHRIKSYDSKKGSLTLSDGSKWIVDKASQKHMKRHWKAKEEVWILPFLQGDDVNKGAEAVLFFSKTSPVRIRSVSGWGNTRLVNLDLDMPSCTVSDGTYFILDENYSDSYSHWHVGDSMSVNGPSRSEERRVGKRCRVRARTHTEQT